MADYEKICSEIKSEEALSNDWSNYIADETYAARLAFDEVVDNTLEVGNYLKNISDTD